MILNKLALILLFTTCVVNGEYCPDDPSEISPCTCDGKTIKCLAVQPFDMGTIFQTLLNGKQHRYYETFELESSAIEKLESLMFRGVMFKNIKLTGCSKLQCVSPMAFGGQEESVETFEATLTHLGAQKSKECDLFGALSTLISVRDIQIIGSQIMTVPDNAFTNKIGDQLNLTSISFSAGSPGGKIGHVGKQAFTKLRALSKLDLSQNMLINIATGAFNITDPITDSLVINLMGNDLIGTSFGRDLTATDVSNSIKLGGNTKLSYLDEVKNTIDMNGDLMEVDLKNK
ncbi:unnamed protein product, partial [Oppiella nova]